MTTAPARLTPLAARVNFAWRCLSIPIGDSVERGIDRVDPCSRGQLSLKRAGPLRAWATRQPQNEVGRRRHAAVSPKQLRTLSPMAMRAHTYLHKRLRNGT